MNRNVLFPVGQDFLDKYMMTVINVYSVFETHSIKCEVPLVRKYKHVYLEWQKEHNMLYSYSELRTLHQNVLHLSSDNLFSLIRLAWLWKTDSSRVKFLEDINHLCDAC